MLKWLVCFIIGLALSCSLLQKVPPTDNDIVNNKDLYMFAEINGLKVLGEDEFLTFETNDPDLAVPASPFLLSTGDIFVPEGSQSIGILEGANKQNMLYCPSTKITVHKYSELQNISVKTSQTIEAQFAQEEIVTVIVEMNLPYDRFYDKKDTKAKKDEKKKKFDEIKGQIKKDIKGKSKIKHDLKVIKS